MWEVSRAPLARRCGRRPRVERLAVLQQVSGAAGGARPGHRLCRLSEGVGGATADSQRARAARHRRRRRGVPPWNRPTVREVMQWTGTEGKPL